MPEPEDKRRQLGSGLPYQIVQHQCFSVVFSKRFIAGGNLFGWVIKIDLGDFA